MSELASPLSPKMSSAQLRKIKKPIIEKRRRERINDSLNTLKALVLDSLQKDESRYSKMEKADILEMTVRHLQTVQRQHMLLKAAEDRQLYTKYRSGFAECANEVNRYLAVVGEDLGPEVRRRLMGHLGKCVQKTPSESTTSNSTAASSSTVTSSTPIATPIAALPGALYGPTTVVNQQQQLSSRTSSPVSQGQCSPLSSSCSSSPTGFSSTSPKVLVVSPTPVHPHATSAAIPLYVSTPYEHSQVGGEAYQRPPHHHHHQQQQSSGSEAREKYASSPVAGDEFPSMYPEHPISSRHTVISSSTQVARIPSIKSEALTARQPAIVLDASVWRPW